MSRVQLSINVSDFDAAVAFHPRLLRAEPAKLRPGYANFAIDDPPLKLVLNSPGAVCCYARQDKVWAHDPDGLAWEYYTVMEHIETP
jgi:hypothetical protein